MTNYRRFFQDNSTWFFTVNLTERKNNHLLVDRIDSLRAAFRYVKQRKRFRIDAVVIMPDHLHAIRTLLPEDAEFSIRWNMLKGHFSRSLEKSESRKKRGERGIWQRRFWAHSITGQQDYNHHVDYIHWVRRESCIRYCLTLKKVVRLVVSSTIAYRCRLSW